MLVVSYYTRGNGYKAEAMRLTESCKRFDIAHRLYAIDDRGSWNNNTAYKAAFLAKQREISRGPIVWVDADGEFKAAPELFYNLHLTGAAIAVHYRDGSELLSGTIWLNDNDVAREILGKWAALCEAEPDVWDQRHLQAVLENYRDHVYNLPAPYCMIFDTMADKGPPVIEHHQASRRLKG